MRWARRYSSSVRASNSTGCSPWAAASSAPSAALVSGGRKARPTGFRARLMTMDGRSLGIRHRLTRQTAIDGHKLSPPAPTRNGRIFHGQIFLMHVTSSHQTWLPVKRRDLLSRRAGRAELCPPRGQRSLRAGQIRFIHLLRRDRAAFRAVATYWSIVTVRNELLQRHGSRRRATVGPWR